MSQHFQTGDRVVCIDDSCSFGRLLVGQIYQVEADFDGSPTVISRGSSHCMERFRLLPNNESARDLLMSEMVARDPAHFSGSSES